MGTRHKFCSWRTEVLGSRTPCSFVPVPQSPADDRDIGKVMYQHLRCQKLRLMARLQKETHHERTRAILWQERIWRSLKISSISLGPVLGSIHFPLTAFTHDLTTSRNYSEALSLVNEKKTANWHYLLERKQTHGMRAFPKLSNWVKMGTFLKINKGVKSCPAGSSRNSPSV